MLHNLIHPEVSMFTDWIRIWLSEELLSPLDDLFQVDFLKGQKDITVDGEPVSGPTSHFQNLQPKFRLILVKSRSQ